jgi:hypothetical protein
MLANTLLLALSFAQVQAPDEAALAAGLVELRAHLSAGRWAPAQAQARLLIEQHQAQPYIWRNLPALRDALEWSAFSSSYRAPAPDDLVSGDLLFYSASGGNARVRYSPEQLADFRDPSDEPSDEPSDTLYGPLIHAGAFAGGYTVDVRGESYACEPGDKLFEFIVPAFSIEDGDGNWTRILCGTAERPDTEKTAPAPGIGPIAEYSGLDASWRTLTARDTSPCVKGKPYRMRAVVAESSITVSYNGKQFFSVQRPARSFGRLAILGFGGFEELTIEGKFEASWIQGLLDAHAQTAWSEFTRKLPESARLPERLTPKSCGARLDQTLRSSRDVLEAFEAQRKALAINAENDKAAARVALYLHVLGEYAELDRLLDQRAQLGRFTQELDQINSTLHRARHGPLWESPARVESANFVVTTDLDLRTARELSALLENSVARFQARLRPNLPRAAERARVFVFSGRLGYERYLAGALGGSIENTAGVYHPGLRQLIVWNAPKRGELFETVRHEGLHQFLDSWLDDPPVWLNEGLAEYYENAEFQRGAASEIRPRAQYLELLVARGPAALDLAALLRATPAAFYEDPQLNYARAWAFVHFLLGSTRENRALFDALIEELAGGASADAAVKKIFASVDVKLLEGALNEHVRALKRSL